MDQAPPEPEESLPPLTPEELAMVEEGLADIEAGRTVSLEAVLAWMNSLGTDHELPPPVAD